MSMVINSYVFASGDPNFNSVSTLLHMETFIPSTSFPFNDGLASPAPTWNTGTSPDSSSNSQFGTHCRSFDGTQSLRSNTHSWAVGTGDFTIEGWFRPTTGTGVGVYRTLFCRQITTGGQQVIQIRLDPNMHLEIVYKGSGGSATGFAGSTLVSLNTYHHFAMCRSSGVVYSFLDGVLQGSSAFTGDLGYTSSNSLGCFTDNNGASNSAFFIGQMDEVRITNGIGRYTTNFTLPTAPFPDHV